MNPLSPSVTPSILFTTNELERVFQRLKPNNALGYDLVCNHIAKVLPVTHKPKGDSESYRPILLPALSKVWVGLVANQGHHCGLRARQGTTEQLQKVVDHNLEACGDLCRHQLGI